MVLLQTLLLTSMYDLEYFSSPSSPIHSTTGATIAFPLIIHPIQLPFFLLLLSTFACSFLLTSLNTSSILTPTLPPLDLSHSCKVHVFQPYSSVLQTIINSFNRLSSPYCSKVNAYPYIQFSDTFTGIINQIICQSFL